uniref:Uncharacterized protein n=1 Tax=Rhizophora mucronata TaxID=61149 RepID=A0A2P2Q4A4_RHIMU
MSISSAAKKFLRLFIHHDMPSDNFTEPFCQEFAFLHAVSSMKRNIYEFMQSKHQQKASDLC